MKTLLLFFLWQFCLLRARLRTWLVKLRYPYGNGVMCLVTPVILYTSAAMPTGARAIISVYRPPTTTDALGNSIASVVPYGSESNGTLLGSYVVENFRLNFKGTKAMRRGTYGEDADKNLTRDEPSLTSAVQMASAGTVTLCPGDYIAISIGMQASSTASSPTPIVTTRWFIASDGIAMDQNQANKFDVTWEFDRQNSSPLLKEF